MLSQLTRCIALVVLLSVDVVLGHTIITYPGYRGNNLYTNGTVEQSNGLGAAWQDGSYIYPYGMEWMYPCTCGQPYIHTHTCLYIQLDLT